MRKFRGNVQKFRKLQEFSRFASFLSDVSQFSPDNMYVYFQVMDSDREQNRERRTKQKLDHASQSGSLQGAHRNYKRTAQRGRPQSVSGTSQGHPCNYSAPHQTVADDNDGYWSFEHVLTPEFNPETGEV